MAWPVSSQVTGYKEVETPSESKLKFDALRNTYNDRVRYVRG